MSYEKIVTLFDTADHAEAARVNLENAGFAHNDISLMGKQGLASSTKTLREPGFWHRLFGRDIEEHEARVYGKAIDSGGTVLTLRVSDADAPRALGILNQHNVVDVQTRAIESGFLSSKAAAPPPAEAMAPAKPLISDIGKGEVLRLAEEQLEVGKRLVNRGTTRVRRYVTETPVEKQVNLHEEHVEIVRRAATDPDYVKDIDWNDRTIEITETAEEAVVNKSMHVTEEVMIGRKGSDHTETIRDKVRQQHLDVERGAEDRGHRWHLPHKEDIK
jgi:uncharacterized protein (TIGR02271 family)